MAATNTLYFCLNSQTRLDDLLAPGSNPVTKTKNTLGTLMALKSDYNRQGWEVLPIQLPGRSRPSSTSNRKVSINGRVRECATVQTSAIDYCAGVTPETTDLVDTQVEISNYRGIQETIDRNLYRDTCDTPDGRAAGVIAYKLAEMANQILVRENLDAVVAMQAAATTYFDGTSSAIATADVLPLYSSTAPIIPQPGNMFILLDQYKRKGYTSINPIGVGGTVLGRWAFDTNLWLGNNDGSDISRTPIFPTYLDYQVDSSAATGNSYLLSWIPGHAQMLYWNDYADGSPLARTSDLITKTTIVIDGELFDLVVYDAACDDYVDITLSRYSKPYTLPSTFFSATCGGEQTILNWELGCADTTCTNIRQPNNIIT